LAFAGCSKYSRTPRTVSGVPIDDRPISASAYAAFLQGAQYEAAGDWVHALDAFREALNHDSSSVEIQTRIASVTCRLYPDAATTEFEAAAERDDDFEALWREWAECELDREKTVRALRFAKQAVDSAPFSLASSVTLSRVYEARKEPTLALRTLIAFVLRFPNDALGWRALYECAQRQNDPVWAGRAAQHLGSQAIIRADAPNGAELLVKVALLERGLSAAREAAIEHGIDAATLSWIALESGRPSEASTQAELVLRADPANFDAAVASLIAHQRLSQTEDFRKVLRRIPRPTGLVSMRARNALGQLLELYFGPDVRRDFERALNPVHTSDVLPTVGEPAPIVVPPLPTGGPQ
jgi:tetratricopeptide (TPR) repeat protein